MGAADKAADLARWKSLRRQLPVFGRLAYPVRAEATKHVRPGCKSPGCPAEQLQRWERPGGRANSGGLHIKKCLQCRKSLPARSRIRGELREADPLISWGRP